MKPKLWINIILLFSNSILLIGQNPINIVFPSPQPNPPNLTINTYTRATTSIKMQPGFKYGFVTGNATNLLNLNLSNLPGYVGSGYVGSASNPPQVNNCVLNPSGVIKPVGETEGSFGVSSSGAATYNIPILVSPGTRNIQPQLSAFYNSQTGIGLLGTSWNLGGLSTITRIGKTPLHDVKYSGVDLSNNDVFAIDGNRMFALSGIYGQSNTNYFTENESFATIVSLNVAGNGPEKFEVKDKNGNTLQYGFTPDSRLTGINNSSVLTWYLNKITDEFGNYMTYSYKLLNGELVIAKIDYTGNMAAGLNTYNSVTFEYMDIAEKTSYYINNIEFKKTQLLKCITSFAMNQIVRKYVFEYDWIDGTYLSLVKEVDSDGNELTPTVFCWSDPNDNVTAVTDQNVSIFSNTADYADLSTVPTDIDGDGFSDQICFNAPGGRMRVLQNNFKNNFGTSNTIGFTSIYDNPVQMNNASRVLASSVTDENYDNKQEVFTVVSDMTGYLTITNGPTVSTSYYILKTTYNNGVNVASLGGYSTNGPYNIYFSPSQFLFDVKDYDGDGINDVLRIDPETIQLTSSNNNTYNFNITGPNNSIARPFNFNNDGKMDYIVLENNNTSVAIRIVSISGNALSQIYSIIYNFPNNTGTNLINILSQFAMGDINGDGLDDLVFITENRNEMFLCKGTGTGFLNPVKINSFTPVSNSPNIQVNLSVQDINGDGKEDIIVTDNSIQISTSTTNNYFTYFSLGDLIIKGGNYSGDWSHAQLEKVYHLKVPLDNHGTLFEEDVTKTIDVITTNNIKGADLNGDGIMDITSITSPGQDRIITNRINGKLKLSIQSIKTPFKNNISVSYANLNKEFYTKTGGTKFELYKKQSTTTYSSPLYKLKPNINVVSSTQQISGYNGQIQHINKYVYNVGVFHTNGRGFIGFEELLSFSDDPNPSGTVNLKIGVSKKSTINTAYALSLPTEQLKVKIISSTVNGIITYNVDNTKPISKISNIYNVVPRNGIGYSIELSSNTKRDYLTSTQETNSYVYNYSANGNISSKTSIFGWSGQTTLKTIQSTFTYLSNNGYYKIQSETITQTQSGQSAYARTTQYNYTNQGNLLSIIKDPTFGNQMLTSTFSQFSFIGHATKTSISAGDIATRTNEVVYDVTGRFITKHINAINDYTDFIYEPKYGNLISSKDVSGNETKYFYDGLGRPIKIELPNNIENKITYNWESPTNYSYDGGLPFGIYSIKTENEGERYVKKYFSSGGELLRIETEDFLGQVVISDSKYNLGGFTYNYPQGMLMESTEPHYPIQQKYLIKKFDYESIFFRPSANQTYSVNGGTSTNTGIFEQMNYNTSSTDLVYNQGFCSTSNQKSQQVKKLLNSAGQISSVQNNYLSSQQIASYVYESNGQPKTITLTNSANTNQSIVHGMVYNTLGQKITLNDPSLGAVNYTYNTLGEILNESDINGSNAYTYDLLGRLVSKTGNLTGSQTYQYVANGNGKEKIDKIISPNTTKEFKYDNLNRLIEHKETIGNKIFKTSCTLDKYGREIEYNYPSGFKIKKQYNSKGYLSDITDVNNLIIWQHTTSDAQDRITEYTYGNGIVTKNIFNDLNFLIEIDHGNGSIHKQNYSYNNLTGNLTERVFRNFVGLTNLKEAFTYDDLDRLTSSTQLDYNNNNVLQTNPISYDVLGNVDLKGDAGDLNYTNPAKPFNLTQIVNPSPNINPNTLNVTYNEIDKVSQISEMGTNKQLDFIYGVDEDRLRMIYSINSVNQYTRYYSENFDRQETNTTFKEWNYIFAPTGLCAIYYNNNGYAQLNYVLNDNIGSPVLLTNNNQQIVEKYSFDSWGRRRNPDTWAYSNIPVSQNMIRGYTLHEHLDEFAMINMNGRVYDPVLGRFIQADNIVQAPDNMQSYNRFAYCFNNPIKYIDPTGHEGEYPVSTFDEMFNTTRVIDEFYSQVSLGIAYINSGIDYVNLNDPSGQNLPQSFQSINGIQNTDFTISNKINVPGLVSGIISVIGGIGVMIAGTEAVLEGGYTGAYGIMTGPTIIGFGMLQISEALNGKVNSYPSGMMEAIDLGFGGDGQFGNVVDMIISGSPKTIASSSGVLESTAFVNDVVNMKILTTPVGPGDLNYFKNDYVLRCDNTYVNKYIR